MCGAVGELQVKPIRLALDNTAKTLDHYTCSDLQLHKFFNNTQQNKLLDATMSSTHETSETIATAPQEGNTTNIDSFARAILPTASSTNGVTAITDEQLESANTRPRPRPFPKDCIVSLEYLANDPLYKTVKPLQVVPGFLDHFGKSNVRLSPGAPEIIRDIRGRDVDMTLDENGFRYVKSATTFKDWDSQSSIGDEYLTEVEDLLRKEVDGCDEIIFYDARVSPLLGR